MNRLIYAVFIVLVLNITNTLADTVINAAGHAPIGVMGDHTHKKNEWMLSYRFMRMDMEGNRKGNDEINPDTIATTIPNRYVGLPGQPPTLRIVPTSMTMDMHMFGAMYAPTDWLTLAMMATYVEKEMEHTTYQGGMGTNQLGTFRVKTNGIGDTKLSGLITVYEEGIHHIHLNAGISLPTGSTDEEHQILTPMGMTPTVRVPYAMQIGSGTYDLLPGVTYTGKQKKLGWGAQYSGIFRLGDSDDDYSLGDKHILTGWLSYQWLPCISNSIRLEYTTTDKIDGRDTNIMGPVQTADPDNYGGDVVNLAFGVNLAAQEGVLRGHRLAIEAVIPLHRDLNGPQMETDFTITAGWQYAF